VNPRRIGDRLVRDVIKLHVIAESGAKHQKSINQSINLELILFIFKVI
jgi:sialic acid synthase SpsE